MAKHSRNEDSQFDGFDIVGGEEQQFDMPPRGLHARHSEYIPEDEDYYDEEYFEEEYYDGKAPWRRRHKWAFRILLAVAALVVVGCVTVAGLCAYWLQDMPDCSDAEDYNVVKATEVYANDRQTLLARFQMEYRIPVNSLDEVSDYVEQGAIAVEDERFYSHPGVDVLSIARAVFNNFTGGNLSGASTITQQLVRNTVLADEMNDISIARKVREAYAAFELENLLSKNEILLLYLNTINYGQGAYGIEAGAQRYFSKHANELSLAQAALLAGIPQSPVYNNPIDFPDHALDRRNHVLDRMAACGYVTEADAASAKAEPIELNVSWNSLDGIEAYPYFASYVRQQLYDAYDLTTAEIFQGGLTVYTTLDLETQAYAETAAEEKEDQVSDAFEVALVAIDPSTGYIKAVVGGKDYSENQFNLATQGARQAGSSFKTFTLISSMEEGIDPQTQVNCTSGVKIGDWKVSNIYGINYNIRSIARAFAVSSNTGFARLVCAVGPEKVAELAHRVGIKSDLDAVPSITLGTNSVTPLEMASAYATIASGGIYYKPECIEQAYDRKGNLVIDNSEPEGKRVLDESIACAAIDVMRLVVESYEGTGSDARLESGQAVAGKTGTSENYKDSWFCGFTPQMAVALWMGDRTNTASIPSSVSVCSAFATFMDAYMEGRSVMDFPTAKSPHYTKKFSNANLDLDAISTDDIKDLTGMTKEEVEKYLEGHSGGRTVTYVEEFSDEVPAGSVIRQTVTDYTVEVVISKGKESEQKKEEEPEKPNPSEKPGPSETPGSGSEPGSGPGASSGASSNPPGGGEGGNKPGREVESSEPASVLMMEDPNEQP